MNSEKYNNQNRVIKILEMMHSIKMGISMNINFWYNRKMQRSYKFHLLMN